MKYLLRILLVFFILFGAISDSYSQRNKNKRKKKPTTKERKADSKSLQKFQYAYGEGTRYKLTYDLNKAALFFRECVKLDPDQPAPYHELADIYHLLGQLSLALESSEKAANLDPDNYWYQIMYAESLQKLDKNAEALAVIEKLAEKYPEKHHLFMKMAMLYFMIEEYDKGIAVLDAEEKKLGPLPKIIEPKKAYYLSTGKTEKAAREVEKLIQAEPDVIEHYLVLAGIYLESKDEEKAMEVFAIIEAKFPGNGRYHLTKADYYHQNGEEEKAFDELKMAFKDKDLNIDTKVKILLSYYQLISRAPELKQEALELNEILIDIHPKEEKAHTIYGDFLYNDRKLEKAKYHFTKALEFNESPFPIWNQLIIIHAELNDFDSVIIVSNKAMELFPNQPSLYYFSGIANAQLDNYQAAIEKFEAGKKMVVDNDNLLNQFHISLGEAYNEEKQYKASDAAYEAALKIDSSNANTLNNYSYYLSLRGENLEKAERMSARSNQLVANQSSYQDTYAWIMYQLKKYEEAKIWIEKAIVNGGGNSAEVLEHAGDIYFKLNDREKATSYWQKAKTANGEGSPFLDQKIRDQQLYE